MAAEAVELEADMDGAVDRFLNGEDGVTATVAKVRISISVIRRMRQTHGQAHVTRLRCCLLKRQKHKNKKAVLTVVVYFLF